MFFFRPKTWAGVTSVIEATELAVVNTNGAGDSFTSGLLVAAMLRNADKEDESLSLKSAGDFATLTAAYHVDVSTRDHLSLDMNKLLEKI